MNDFDRLREILPFAVALTLAVGVAQLQATPPASRHARSTISIEDVVSGLKRYMIAVAKYQQNEMTGEFYGD